MTIKSGMDPVHPGQVLREELDAWPLGECVGQGNRRACESSHGNPQRGAGHHRRYRPAPRPPLRHHRTVLAQLAAIRLAESKSGSRILEGIVPRQAEALRTAARQAIAASDQAATMLKAIARNMASCGTARVRRPMSERLLRLAGKTAFDVGARGRADPPRRCASSRR